jgi:hypothetical protein
VQAPIDEQRVEERRIGVDRPEREMSEDQQPGGDRDERPASDRARRLRGENSMEIEWTDIRLDVRGGPVRGGKGTWR